ncbi:MAG TPA: hypothetical protein VIL85_19080 [Thermomicrobiales bacterium]
MERPQRTWRTETNVPPPVLIPEEERGSAALRELRAYPFFSAGGDTFDRLASFPKPNQLAATAPGEAEREALGVALCQSHAKVRAIEKLLAEALAALHAPLADGVAIPTALTALLSDTGQQLIALGQHFRANE